MHPLIDEIFGYCCMGRSAAKYDLLEEQPPMNEKKGRPETTESQAADILWILYDADTNDERLAQSLQDIVHTTEWYEELGAAVLNGLEIALGAETPMGQAMGDAYGKATQAVADVLEFAREHPYFCAFVAVGILAILAPWALEAIGFGARGPIANTFAALWQSARYGGYIPAGSWFSFFQRLGMKWVASPTMVDVRRSSLRNT